MGRPATKAGRGGFFRSQGTRNRWNPRNRRGSAIPPCLSVQRRAAGNLCARKRCTASSRCTMWLRVVTVSPPSRKYDGSTRAAPIANACATISPRPPWRSAPEDGFRFSADETGNGIPAGERAFGGHPPDGPPPDTEAFAFAMKAAFQLSEMQNEFFRKPSKGRMPPGTARLPFRGCAIKMVDAFFLAVP